VRLRILWIILIAALFLSGCVKYDVGIHYDGQNHGEIVQHVRLSDHLTNFSDAAQDWLHSVEQRTKQLGGRVKRLSNQ
jgi:PBP1b-binding outer membrane lipoprotein LpoB